MKRLAGPWTEPFKSVVQNIPADAEVKVIRLEDWVPEHVSQGRGRITMIGDAAHPMTMCTSDVLLICFCVHRSPMLKKQNLPESHAVRGEGANHAILDVSNLVRHLQPLASKIASQSEATAPDNEQLSRSIQGAITEFEEERGSRCRIAVQTSRQACLDAHEHERINENSPLLMRRAAVPTKA